MTPNPSNTPAKMIVAPQQWAQADSGNGVAQEWNALIYSACL